MEVNVIPVAWIMLSSFQMNEAFMYHLCAAQKLEGGRAGWWVYKAQTPESAWGLQSHLWLGLSNKSTLIKVSERWFQLNVNKLVSSALLTVFLY